jgi:hypothetical protein
MMPFKRNLDTSGTIKIDIYTNYIKYTSNNENEGCFGFLKSIMKMDGMPISMVKRTLPVDYVLEL